MSNAVDIKIPSSVVYSPLVTSNPEVDRHRYVEFLPNQQTTYSYGGNDEIQFHIASYSEFLDTMDSYLRFNLKTVGSDKRALDEGGVHSLFRTVEVRTANGVLIQRIENYNLLYAVLSNMNHDRDHVERVEWSAYDSVDGLDAKKGQDLFQPLSGDDEKAEYDHSSKTLTLDGGKANSELKVGDLILVSAGGETKTGKVASITNDTTVVLTDDINGGSGLSAGAIDGIYRLRDYDIESDFVKPMRQQGPQQDDLLVSMKPMLSFLQARNWLPLMYMANGIHIILKLEQPSRCMNQNYPVNAQSGLTALGYTISNPRYVCSLYTLGGDTRIKMMNKFKNEGFSFGLENWHSSKRSISGTESGSTQVLQIRPGGKSTTKAITVIQPSRIVDDNDEARASSNSLSTFCRAGLSKYQYKAGSNLYPQNEVNCDKFSVEAYKHFEFTKDSHGNKLENTRFEPHEWRSQNVIPSSTSAAKTTVSNITDEATKFMCCVRMDRFGYLTGADLSVTPLDVELTFSSTVDDAFGNRTIYILLASDAKLVISEKEGVKIYR